MSTRGQILEDGFTAGMIGFATTVVVFGVANVLAGQSPIHTAALLGGALFWGDASRAVGGVGSALAYSVVHFAVFVLFGIGAAALASLADRGYQLWFVSLFFFIFVSFHLFAAVQALAFPRGEELSGIAVWSAGIASSLLMALFLIRAHPRLRLAQAW